MAAPPQFISRRRRRGSEGVVSPLCGNEFYMLWRSCIGPPRQPKLALSLPIKEPSFCRLTVVGGSAAFGSENRTTSLRSWKCTPFPAYGGTSPKGKHVTGFSGRFTPLQIQFLCHPGGGKSALRSAFALTSIVKHSAAKISPSGGDAATGGRRGAFPRATGPVLWFSPARKGGLPVFPRAKARL